LVKDTYKRIIGRNAINKGLKSKEVSIEEIIKVVEGRDRKSKSPKINKTKRKPKIGLTERKPTIDMTKKKTKICLTERKPTICLNERKKRVVKPAEWK
jgi:hypothetical protein